VSTRRRAFVGLSLFVGATGAAACNFLVDAGDYSVGTASTDASVDTGIPGSDTGAPGDSGSADTFQPGTDTGAPGDSGPPKEGGAVCGQLPTTNATFQQLVSSCTIALSCDPVDFADTISECVTNDFLHSATELMCLVGITSCAGFQSCLGFAQPTAAQCPASTTPSYCNDAGVGINCGLGGGQALTQDCNVLGGTCEVYGADAGSGAMAGCKVLSSCSEPSNPTDQYCSSNDLYACVGGQGYGQNCGANQTCAEDPLNGTGCYFTAPSCNYQGSDVYTCSGSTLDLCTQGEGSNNGAQFTYDCASAGLACVADSDGMGDPGCLAPGCTPADANNCAESCSGSMATVCVGGAPYTFDCASIGATGTFSTCQSIMDGTGQAYVYCQ
jgi:hypothetical protein